MISSRQQKSAPLELEFKPDGTIAIGRMEQNPSSNTFLAVSAHFEEWMEILKELQASQNLKTVPCLPKFDEPAGPDYRDDLPDTLRPDAKEA